MRRKTFLILSFSIFCVLGIYSYLNFAFLYTKYHTPVSKVYVMNLDKNKERLATISNSLNEQHINFTRFPAISGLDLKIEGPKGTFSGKDLKDGKESFRIGEKYKVQCPNITINYEYFPSLARGHGSPLTAGELGIYCSHFEIMLDVIKNRYQSVVVFEDDAVIPNNFSEELKLIEQNMPNHKKYGIIFLGHGLSSTKWIDRKLKIKTILFNNALDAITDYKMNAGSTHAILFGYGGAKIMLDSIKPHAGIDLDLFRSIEDGTVKAFNAKRLNIQQGNAESDIEAMGRKL